MTTRVPVAPQDLRTRPLTRRTLAVETGLVLLLSLAASGLRALVSFVGDLTRGPALNHQIATLNGSYARGRPWLDLTYQLLNLTLALVPVALVAHLLSRTDESLSTIGADTRRPRPDLLLGAGLAAAIGGTGLALYLAAHAAGANLTVVPSALPDVWWRIPVLLLSAAENAVLEEVVVLGYLLHRLRQVGWGDRPALVTSSLLRGSYHLYQGLGGFVGNALMGALFAALYQRRGRAAPFVLAHFLIDAVAFVGYVLLAGHVSWLPTG